MFHLAIRGCNASGCVGNDGSFIVKAGSTIARDTTPSCQSSYVEIRNNLIDNGIMSNPKYGGLLELTEPPLFIDLISYNGSTEDPHMIFLAKNMASITNNNGHSKILASFKEIPYISREQSVHILDILNNIGFPIYKIGKPREVTYNAKANNYNFGIVTGSGLNSIAAIKEKGIAVNVKAIAKLLPFEKMDRL